MLDKIKLQKLKKAVKSMATVDDKFFAEGENFSCRWNGFGFDWCILGSVYKNCTKKKFCLGLMTADILRIIVILTETM